MMCSLRVAGWLAMIIAGANGAFAAETVWLANDAEKVVRIGAWQWTAHRYAAERALVTSQEGAALEFTMTGRGLVLAFDTLTPPNHFGPPELGALDVFVDDRKVRTLRPREEANEVTLIASPAPQTHRVRLVHRRDDSGGVGVRIRGVRMRDDASGELGFTVSAEHNGALVDVRAVLTRQGRVVRDELVRNWLTGRSRLAGLPPGDDYALEVRAAGWKARRVEAIAIRPEAETALPAIYLEREWDVPVDDFKFPAFGRAVVRHPSGSLSARFETNQLAIREVRLVRAVGPATISRACAFEEDKGAAFYYHREGVVRLPADMPAGLYDLEVSIGDGATPRKVVSRRAVFVVTQMPANPVFFSFGHLDTWGQYQAEYLARLVTLANVLGPDMMLVSNEANPAYAAGALYGLDVPFVINFGNHRSPDPGPWFGELVSVVDFGTELSVLNFGRAWDGDITEADRLLAARSGARTRIINAFESNAPVADFLDRHRVALIHYAHGPGPAVARMGTTPTIRVGKVNSESFRVIRFENGRPASYTYRGHATAPIPFPRNGPAPVRLRYTPANDGLHRDVTAQFENDLEAAFPRARAVFVLPKGRYQPSQGTIESAIDSDDAKFTVVTVRVDLAAQTKVAVRIQPSAQ